MGKTSPTWALMDTFSCLLVLSFHKHVKSLNVETDNCFNCLLCSKLVQPNIYSFTWPSLVFLCGHPLFLPKHRYPEEREGPTELWLSYGKDYSSIFFSRSWDLAAGDNHAECEMAGITVATAATLQSAAFRSLQGQGQPTKEHGPQSNWCLLSVEASTMDTERRDLRVNIPQTVIMTDTLSGTA